MALRKIGARRIIEVDPYNEIAHRTLMHVFAEEGEPARVRDVYNNLQHRLRRELGVEPDTATTALYHSLIRVRDRGADHEPDEVSLPIASSPVVHAVGSMPVSDPRGGRRRKWHSASHNPAARSERGPGSTGSSLPRSLIEDITIGLCRFKSLSVVAPHTAWEFTHDGSQGCSRRSGSTILSKPRCGTAARVFGFSVKLVDAVSRDIIWTEQSEFKSFAWREAIAAVRSVLLRLWRRSKGQSFPATMPESERELIPAYLSGQR